MIKLKRPFLFICFLFIGNLVFSQETVKIKFYNKSSNDYDLMISDILNQNGYKSYVDYKNDTTKTDYILSYNTTSRQNYDELKSFKLFLLSSDSTEINKVDQEISYFNFGVNEFKEILKGLELLFNKNFSFNNSNFKPKVSNFNINFNVTKIDSAKYIIIAKGAAIRSLESIESAFLKKSSQFLTSFDYYTKNGVYNYSAPGGSVNVAYTGYQVVGIITKPTAENIITKLDKMPSELLNYLGKN